MTSKHQDATWQKTVRIVRAQVRQAWARGDEVTCWRHGHVIPEGAPYDVGHLDPHGPPTVENAAPECRSGNRSEGGRRGAAITNTKRTGKSSFTPLPWA